MPSVYPFRAVQYASFGSGGDLSDLVAPPYDVLDARGKDSLLSRSDRNIVAVDLPHLPAKQLGPPGAYAGAAEKYRGWLTDGTLARRERPAIFIYRQTFRFGGAEHSRTGVACAVETLPFGPRDGGGILPHEETFSGPKEDRFALMRATKAQLSPIFGLHHDAEGKATEFALRSASSRGPDAVARTGDGVLHEVWAVEDEREIGAYASALAGEDVFIADGHHRYNTALNYLKKLEEEQGEVPVDHPARRCMIVLVGMSDPGMVIGPTHRVLGGMAEYSWEKFEQAASGVLKIEAVDGDLGALEREIAGRGRAQGVLGLYDFASGRCFVAEPKGEDPLAERFPGKPRAWRTLDVALVQHLIVEEICSPRLNRGEAVSWAFPHSVEEVLDIGAGRERGSGGGSSFRPQLAVIVQPTPLEAVREVSAAGELMPQKSTFFYPKLATGLFINPLD